MAELISTKPYMVRAIQDWCVDNGLTPHLLVHVDANTRVPVAYVKEGEIVLNLSYSATKDLHIDNDTIVFSARFGGVPHNLYIPMDAVKGIFARENGQGMFFDVPPQPDPEKVVAASAPVSKPEAGKEESATKKKPTLTIVK
jgi:stringent starvation protein B